MKDIEVLDKMTGSASRITIAVHTHPDGDAVGSGTALLFYLTEIRGKDAVLIVPDSIPDTLSFITEGVVPERLMVFDNEPDRAADRIASSDLVFCLDCGSFSRTAGMETALRNSKAGKVMIDHHLNPERECFDLAFSETEISSASELLYDVLMKMPDVNGNATALPCGCAAALLTGMTTDTNNFANSVFPGTLEMAATLIGAGVDRDEILSRLYNNYRENRLRLMGFLMSERLKITPDGVAYIILDEDIQKRFDFRRGESEGFVNMPLSIAAVRMSIFLTQEGDVLRVSVRSKKGTSANVCAATYFNGGGHEQAAGGKLVIGKDLGSVSDVEAYILKATGKFLGK